MLRKGCVRQILLSPGMFEGPYVVIIRWVGAARTWRVSHLVVFLFATIFTPPPLFPPRYAEKH